MRTEPKEIVCSMCEQTKPVSEYYKNKKSGYYKWCKRCHEERFRRTRSQDNLEFIGRLRSMYEKVGERTRMNGFTEKLTREQWENYILENLDTYEFLYKQWRNGGFKQMHAPSVDRVNRNLGYTLDNIQLLSHQDNSVKGKRNYRIIYSVT